MKILFCGETHLSRELGASKVIIELAEEMAHLGWHCQLLSPYDLIPRRDAIGYRQFPMYLREYLRKSARHFDVVEYGHHHLPFPRSEFPAETLFVARSVLLTHHFDKIHIPRERGLRAGIHRIVKERDLRTRREQLARDARFTVQEADLVNVANDEDQAELIRSGVEKQKIAVIPYGMSRNRLARFEAASIAASPEPTVAFVGTFDSRKGATDFPAVVANVCAATPAARFRLVGTHRDKSKVLAAFPRGLRSRIEVVPQYRADDLPELLAPCSVGVFPSYLEGFGLGVLEMLAASIPVIAYDSPGPPMMLAPEYLVRRGDTNAMSRKVTELLGDDDKLLHARCWARHRAHDFSWWRIAQQTTQIYTRRRPGRALGTSEMAI